MDGDVNPHSYNQSGSNGGHLIVPASGLYTVALVWTFDAAASYGGACDKANDIGIYRPTVSCMGAS